jgi:isopenicillin N synthase-like dioxygenase
MNVTKDRAGVAPVIDIAPFFSGSPAAKAAVAQSIGAACEYTGFFLITGHGVERGIIDDMVSSCRSFFALPNDVKARACPSVVNGPGYRPTETVALAATLDAESPPDLKEGFLISPLFAERKLPKDYVYGPLGTKWFRENVWPAEVPRFREAWTSYYAAMESLAATLMGIAAIALDLPETHFATAFDRHISQLTARNYPPIAHEPKPGQLRAGAHTDYGALTILWKDEGSGSLQVVDKDRQWQDIIPEPDCLVINIGDLLAQWTNDRWVSTLHRVALPSKDEDRSTARLSVPFFYKPNYDAVVETLESCIDDEHPKRYAPVTAGEHMSMKRDKHVVRDEP